MRASPFYFFLLACSTACQSTKPSQLTMVKNWPIGIYKKNLKTQKNQILAPGGTSPFMPILLSHCRKAKVAPFETVVNSTQKISKDTLERFFEKKILFDGRLGQNMLVPSKLKPACKRTDIFIRGILYFLFLR